MPTYQYRCKSCDNDLEVVQKFTDDPLTECPACDGQLRKVYGAVGVVFKGSGFYKTDSRSGGSSTTSGSGGSTKQGGSDSSTGGSGGSSTSSTDSGSGPKTATAPAS